MNDTQTARVRDYLERARPLSPALLTPEDHVSRGNAHYALGEYNQALEEYAAALAQRPTYVNALFNQGVVLAKTERYQEAEVAFIGSIGLANAQDVLLADAYYYLAVVRHAMSRNVEALEAISQASQRSADPTYSYLRARLHSVLGQQAEALDWLRRAAATRKKYLEDARHEPDFEPIRSNPDFAHLTA